MNGLDRWTGAADRDQARAMIKVQDGLSDGMIKSNEHLRIWRANTWKVEKVQELDFPSKTVEPDEWSLANCVELLLYKQSYQRCGSFGGELNSGLKPGYQHKQ